jgi:lysophospholipase L1-like esterase
MKLDIGRRLGLLGVGVVAAAVAILPGTGAAEGRPLTRWLGSWAASPSPPDLAGPSVSGFANQTLREVVYLHFGGGRVRVRVSNAFGASPLSLGRATVALRAPGAAIVPGSARALTFAGSGSTVVPAGAEVFTDPANLRVRAGQELAISLFFPTSTGPTTFHSLAVSTNYMAAGDHASDVDATAFTGTARSWFLLDGVDVEAARVDDAVVTLGDSITDGFASTVDANNRWPDVLSRRLNARPGNRTSVLDEGISGNRVLNNAPCCGVDALARLDRDVLTQHGVRFVILLEGINDIGFSQLNFPETAPNTDVSAAQIIAGYRQIIDEAHARGVRIYGATLTPFEGAGYETPAGLAKRDAVNAFIRTRGAFDAVIDFDRVTRDPANPERFLPAFDSGDHLHPNDAGYRAMANAIPLALFQSGGDDSAQ